MHGTRSFSIPTPAGRSLDAVLHLPERDGRRPAVVICHGFKGFMDWGFFPGLATLLAERGLAAVRFNLTSSGMRPGDELVTNLEAFRDATFTQDLEELEAALTYVASRLEPERIDAEKVGLLGHSRGGGTAVLAAAAAPWRERLRALVTWSAVSTFDRYDAEQVAAWRRTGMAPVVNARTGQELALGLALLEDFEANREDLDILAAARRVAAPWLVVHGTEDETVAVAEADAIHEAAGCEAELVHVPGATHTFNVGHPFTAPSRELIQAMNATQIWFRRHLSEPAQATDTPYTQGE